MQMQTTNIASKPIAKKNFFVLSISMAPTFTALEDDCKHKEIVFMSTKVQKSVKQNVKSNKIKSSPIWSVRRRKRENYLEMSEITRFITNNKNDIFTSPLGE